jgi:cytochrome P450
VINASTGAANRDERKFKNGDAFNINRERVPHLSFGAGFHNCLGNALACAEGGIALEELLNRFPEWDIDLDRATLSRTSSMRGWETLPGRVKRAKTHQSSGEFGSGAPPASRCANRNKELTSNHIRV